MVPKTNALPLGYTPIFLILLFLILFLHKLLELLN